MGKFTDDELAIAKAVDLVDLAESVGIPLRRKGNYYQIEKYSSAIIFNRATWCRYSRGVGGSTIDFLMYFRDMEYKDAVNYLLDYAGYRKTDIQLKPEYSKELIEKLEGKQRKREKAPFVLPDRAKECRRGFAYLIKQRQLSKKVVQFWLKQDLFYESLPYHNIVFLGRDPQGEAKFASQRGTVDIYGKEPFKVDVEGNDKNYGVNLIITDSKELNVYEAAIDCMSDMDFRDDYKTSILALGMLGDKPLEKLLEHEKQIEKINICLDNDLPGRKAAKRIGRKYVLAGYEVSVRLPPLGKDYNEFLKCERENRVLYAQLDRVRSKNKASVLMDRQEDVPDRYTIYFPEGINSAGGNCMGRHRCPETAARR